MRFKTITTLPELEAIGTAWNHLFLESASRVPFLRHEYLLTWWKTLGGGEWDHGDLHIVCAYADESDPFEPDTLIGIAPLFQTTNLDGKKALMFIGSIEISDYLDVIAPPEIIPDFIDALLVYLKTSEAPPWEVLDFYNLLEESATIPALEASVSRHAWLLKKERIQPAPSIPLPDSWDEYLAGIKKKQRHEIRRKIRRAESNHAPLRWYIVDDEDKLDEEIDAFLTLMAYDPEKDSFLTEVMRTQMRQAVHIAFRAGWLQLAFLEFGGEKAAGYLNFDDMGKIWIYNSGINYKYYDLSPGWVLLAYLIQWGIENGRALLDFMRGDEAYKYRFGGQDRFVMRVQITR
jgi:CelD/BcsL family acetyltransferase involved in cellulose biosynthesis